MAVSAKPRQGVKALRAFVFIKEGKKSRIMERYFVYIISNSKGVFFTETRRREYLWRDRLHFMESR
jgi:hypothetical protein